MKKSASVKTREIVEVHCMNLKTVKLIESFMLALLMLDYFFYLQKKQTSLNTVSQASCRNVVTDIANAAASASGDIVVISQVYF